MKIIVVSGVADPDEIKELLTCGADEFRARAESGTLSAADFFALELRPNDPQTSYFTVPGGVLHDELTYFGPGRAPIFFVPEPSRMENTRVPLTQYEILIQPAESAQA
jgi:hypothetical protein